MVAESPQPVAKTLTYDRDVMAERGRRGGRAKAANRKAAVVLTAGEVKALIDAHALLSRIIARAESPDAEEPEQRRAW